jgi:hypothetical protein
MDEPAVEQAVSPPIETRHGLEAASVIEIVVISGILHIALARVGCNITPVAGAFSL